tara:strand:- start:282 stop:1133 length:852 start_codon:yes stop_codon:yes gene_type:complete
MKYILSLILMSISFTQVFSSYDYLGSRATAMSGAVTSGDHIESGIFHNPAQLSNYSDFTIISGYSNLYGLDFLPLSHIGISINNYALNFENISTKYGGNTLSSETTFGIAKGFELYSDRQSLIQMGLRLNLYNYEFGQSAGTQGDGSNGVNLGTGNASGIDIGFQGILNKKYYIAYYIKNISTYIEGSNLGESLPKNFSIGLSYLPYKDLITSLDINQISGSLDSEIRFGIEYKLMESFTIRTGLQSNPNRFSGGFEFGNISYSFITHHVLPTTHQFSIALNF